MIYSTVEHLGVLFAYFSKDLEDNSDNIEALQKMELVSRTLKNFIHIGRDDLLVGFEEGYAKGQSEIRQSKQMERKHGFSLDLPDQHKPKLG